jgi:hypothetical protein
MAAAAAVVVGHEVLLQEEDMEVIKAKGDVVRVSKTMAAF